MSLRQYPTFAICGRRPPRKVFSWCFDQTACAHMSGLFARSQIEWVARDGFRDDSSKTIRDLIEATGECGTSLIEDRLITPSAHLARSGRSSARLQLFASRVWLIASLRRRTRRAQVRNTIFSGNHQFPGDAHHLVGQCDSGQLRRLEFEEPS